MPFRPISILYSGSFRCIFFSFRSISVKQLLSFPMFLRTGTTGYYTDNSQNSVCVRSGLLAGLLALASTVLCFLSLALTVMCYRAKRLVKGCGGDDPAHHVITGAPARCFLTHKGRINWRAARARDGGLFNTLNANGYNTVRDRSFVVSFLLLFITVTIILIILAARVEESYFSF